jgi:hypothetical protein
MGGLLRPNLGKGFRREILSGAVYHQMVRITEDYNANNQAVALNIIPPSLKMMSAGLRIESSKGDLQFGVV